MSANTRLRQRGFTLIEVMIVVAIVAILAAIAIPSFVEQINRGRRGEARAALLEAAHWQERFRTENNAYSCTLPTGLQNVPPNGTANYAITVASALDGTAGCTGNPTTFTLVATPATGGRMVNDDCGTFRLNSLGVRSVVVGTTVSTTGTTFERCWAR